jgi:protein SCO1/2
MSKKWSLTSLDNFPLFFWMLSMKRERRDYRIPAPFLPMAPYAFPVLCVCLFRRSLKPVIFAIISFGFALPTPASGQRPMTGIEEKVGSAVPPNIVLNDEKGDTVSLRELTDKPAILSLVYYSCGSRCPLLLGNLAQAVSSLSMATASYRVITVSFDDSDTPLLAAEKKRNYIKGIGKPFPGSSWRFLTGDRENIERLTESVGFSFRKEPGGFSHPCVLIFLSPGGVVSRYLYGMSFLPFDVQMALRESAGEKSYFSADRLALICYSYDPEGNRYVFHLARSLAAFFFVLMTSSIVLYWVARRKDEKR